MNFPKAYIDDVVVRMAYHSSAIENSELRLSEIAAILLHNHVPNQITLRHLYEIDNYRYAVGHVLAPENIEAELSIPLLVETYLLLTQRLPQPRGVSVKMANPIKNIEDTEAFSKLLTPWLEQVKYRMELATTEQQLIEVICDSHLEFEGMRPFTTGNEGIGQIMMNYLFVKNNIAPLIIERQDKESYRYFLLTDAKEDFSRFAYNKIAQEKQIMNSFLANNK